jgi:hypothetical protein
VLLADRAGWHMAAKLEIPANITLLPLPPRSPELNPVENVWQFLRDNWLSNRVFGSYDDIVAHCCAAWTKLISAGWYYILTDWCLQSVRLAHKRPWRVRERRLRAVTAVLRRLPSSR